jgi:hypothetical protein
MNKPNSQLWHLNIRSWLRMRFRRPQAMWRGRASPERRDLLRRQFAACPEMFKALRARDQELFNVWHPDVRLHEACAWRCAPPGCFRLKPLQPVLCVGGAFRTQMRGPPGVLPEAAACLPWCT